MTSTAFKDKTWKLIFWWGKLTQFREFYLHTLKIWQNWLNIGFGSSHEISKMNDSVFRSQLSFFPFANESGGLNIVSGVEAVAHRILHILLLQKGEDPLHPEIGMSPQLFTSLSDDSVDAFRDEAQKVLETWNQKGNIGFGQVWVDTTTVEGKIYLKVTFTVDDSDSNHVLTFDWQLINALTQRNKENAQKFLKTIQIS